MRMITRLSWIFRVCHSHMSHHHTLHDACSDADGTAYSQNAHAVRFQLPYSRLDGGFHRAPAQLRAIRLCAGQPGIDPFPNDTPLELCEYASI
jgi:hypothetical protein